MTQPIRTFNRYELKYLLDVSHAKEVQECLLDYMLPDEHGDEHGNYTLNSLYYDSEDYRFYWEKVEGIRFRRKLRIRRYETPDVLSPDTKVFVEIKQRLDRVTQKRRILVPFKDALTLCKDHEIPADLTGKDAIVANEMLHMIKDYNLKPQCITSYKRRAFNGTMHDPGLRVTFDTNMRYRKDDLDLASKNIGKFMLPPDQCIMEVKVNDRIPYWLTEFAADNNFQLRRISKYCQSLQMSDAVPSDCSYQFA